MKNITKTVIFTILLSLVSILAAIIVQLRAETFLTTNCSYFDPIAIDLLAFAGTLFLIIEGGYRIAEHKNAQLKKQITRSIRIALGLSIMSLHILQFLAK